MGSFNIQLAKVLSYILNALPQSRQERQDFKLGLQSLSLNHPLATSIKCAPSSVSCLHFFSSNMEFCGAGDAMGRIRGGLECISTMQYRILMRGIWTWIRILPMIRMARHASSTNSNCMQAGNLFSTGEIVTCFMSPVVTSELHLHTAQGTSAATP